MSEQFQTLALQTIQSQYGNSPRIKSLILKMAERIDNTADITLFYDKIFNPLTAEGVGLDIWGEIVGVPRSLVIVDETLQWFGFEDGTSPQTPTKYQNFNNAPFFNPQQANVQYNLTDNAYRALILYKSICNISDDSVASMNRNLRYLYSEGRLGTAIDVYITETSPMNITVNYSSTATLVQLKILQTYGMFNKPAGVSVSFNPI